MFTAHGTKWTLIAKQVPHRSCLQIKNRYYGCLKKQIEADEFGYLMMNRKAEEIGPGDSSDSPASDTIPIKVEEVPQTSALALTNCQPGSAISSPNTGQQSEQQSALQAKPMTFFSPQSMFSSKQLASGCGRDPCGSQLTQKIKHEACSMSRPTSCLFNESPSTKEEVTAMMPVLPADQGATPCMFLSPCSYKPSISFNHCQARSSSPPECLQ